jgi:SAM-dependent methyltransferase
VDLKHQEEVDLNVRLWERKPILRRVYKDFFTMIAGKIDSDLPGDIVEIGSGIGDIQEVIPNCIRTDFFSSPWIDRVENIYHLSFPTASLSHLVMIDVFHHLKHPGNALDECRRVLVERGRIILLEPYISVLGLFVYGFVHREPVSLFRPIAWHAPASWSWQDDDYYAAQGNATRVFESRKYLETMQDWSLIHKRRMAALHYVASGGYRGPQLYPDKWFSRVKAISAVLDHFPSLFATRLLAVLERR